MDSARNKQRNASARARGTLAAVWCLCVPILVACSSKPQHRESSETACRASCIRLAPDGESCLEWAALTSSACVERYSSVSLCCGAGDKPICAVSSPVATGTACVCRGSDRLGAYVVQGSACRSP